MLLLVFLFASFHGGAQTFTLTIRQEPLVKVFTQIEQLSDFRFLYTEELLSRSTPVSFSVRNVSLDSVLRNCFRNNQSIDYIIEGKHIILRKKNTSRPVIDGRTLRGRVVNDMGEPVEAVTIRIRNSLITTVSNAHGEFFFSSVPESVILAISGAEIELQEVDASRMDFIQIRVRSKPGLLDETLVIAYGKTKRRISTSSISRVTHEEISKQPISNPMLALSGRVSGVQITQTSGAPGSLVIVQIRGRNSIANGNDPLYIIDGVPYPTTTLNNALAGASTISSPFDNINPADIERIDILKDADATAIYGSRGANGVILITTKRPAQGRLAFSVRAHQGWGAVTRKLDMLNTRDYVTMRKEAFANDGATPTLSNAPDLLLWDTTRYTDWQEKLIGNTVRQQDLNFSLSGGNELTQFMFGSGYHRETTVFPGEFNAEKISGSLSLNHQTGNRKFSISFSGSYLINRTHLPREDVSRRITLSPNAPEIYLPSGAFNWENGTWLNPFAILERVFTNKTQVLTANLSLSYKIVPSLHFKITNGFTWQTLKEHGTMPQKANNPATTSNSSATFGRADLQTVITEPQVTYFRQAKLHQVEAVAGLTIQQTDKQNIQQTGTGYATDALLHSLQAASSVTTLIDNDSRYRYTGQFARLSYNYDRKYLGSLTVRRDGSSRYGPSNRFAGFYSAGFGWVFTREPWLKNQRWFSFGKIRTSVGKTGNDQIGDYRFMDLYSTNSSPYQSVTTFSPTQLFNPDFSWEKVNKVELGIELGFFKDAWQFTANYYHNNTRNQLIQYPLPVTTGFSGILLNIPATIRNKGLEFELSGNLVRKTGKSWTMAVNLTIPRNKLVDFDDLESSSYANSYVIGQPLSIVKTYELTGVDPSTGIYSFTDYNNDGNISTPQDQQKLIDPSQRFYGGMQHSIHFGKWSFSCLLQFARQPYTPNFLLRFSRPGSAGNQPVAVMNRWKKPGEMSDIQRFAATNSAANAAYGRYQFSEAGYSNGSFIRLRNLYVEYDLLAGKNKKPTTAKCVLFIQGHNLFTITDYDGLDPETQTFLPPLRMITTGIQLNL